MTDDSLFIQTHLKIIILCAVAVGRILFREIKKFLFKFLFYNQIRRRYVSIDHFYRSRLLWRPIELHLLRNSHHSICDSCKIANIVRMINQSLYRDETARDTHIGRVTASRKVRRECRNSNPSRTKLNRYHGSNRRIWASSMWRLK